MCEWKHLGNHGNEIKSQGPWLKNNLVKKKKAVLFFFRWIRSLIQLSSWEKPLCSLTPKPWRSTHPARINVPSACAHLVSKTQPWWQRPHRRLTRLSHPDLSLTPAAALPRTAQSSNHLFISEVAGCVWKAPALCTDSDSTKPRRRPGPPWAAKREQPNRRRRQPDAGPYPSTSACSERFSPHRRWAKCRRPTALFPHQPFAAETFTSPSRRGDRASTNHTPATARACADRCQTAPPDSSARPLHRPRMRRPPPVLQRSGG